MKNNWKKVKLEEVAEVIAGQSPSSKTYNTTPSGLPFFQGKADFGQLYPKARIWCSEPIKIANENDVLISVRAPVGPTNICDIKACIGRGLSAIRSGEKLYFKYLLYYLRFIERELINKARGSTFSSITQSDLKSIMIPLPPLSEQKRIVSILDKANSLVEKRKEAVELLDEYLKSVFLDMFGDPVKNPKGWEMKTIEEIVKKDKYSIKRGPFGGALKKDIFKDNGYLVYEQYHALNNEFSMARYFIDEKKFNEMKMFEVNPGDIIISCSGVYLGKLAIVPQGALKGIINQALLKVTLDESIMLNEFFLSVFTNKNFKKMYFENKIGSGIPNFPPMTEFKKFKFICPPIIVQKKYISIIQKKENIRKSMKNQLQAIENNFNNLVQTYLN